MAGEVILGDLSPEMTSPVLLRAFRSGGPEPSPDDIDYTRRVVRAGRLMGIGVLDHVVLGEGERYVIVAEQVAGIWKRRQLVVIPAGPGARDV